MTPEERELLRVTAEFMYNNVRVNSQRDKRNGYYVPEWAEKNIEFMKITLENMKNDLNTIKKE